MKGYIKTETDTMQCPTRPWGPFDKLKAKFFPFRPCDLPAAPPSFKDVLIVRTRSELSFVDRLRVLLTGKIETESRTVTENMVGNHYTHAVIRCGRFST